VRTRLADHVSCYCASADHVSDAFNGDVISFGEARRPASRGLHPHDVGTSRIMTAALISPLSKCPYLHAPAGDTVREMS
jgi:hypothetical protein